MTEYKTTFKIKSIPHLVERIPWAVGVNAAKETLRGYNKFGKERNLSFNPRFYILACRGVLQTKCDSGAGELIKGYGVFSEGCMYFNIEAPVNEFNIVRKCEKKEWQGIVGGINFDHEIKILY